MLKSVVLALLLAVALSAPLLDVQAPIDGEYIVVLSHDAMGVDNHFARMAQRGHHVQADHVYNIGAFRGYAAKLSEEALDAVLNSTDVAYVEPNSVIEAVGTCSMQGGATWGLTRVSNKELDLSLPFTYPSTGGASVLSFIVDTGINIGHVEFEGRATFGFKADKSWSDTDANGHGTHVAGTVGGKTYGIAKRTNLIAVKVLGDNGSGTNAGVIAGIDYVTKYDKKGKRASANMSLGGGASAALDQAVTNSVASGVTYAVAAGNDNANACNYSPARVAAAISVGSTSVANQGKFNEMDARSSFSNWGKCVHILAPGSLITSAWKGTTTAINTISGTSMASPHVCGIITLYLEANPTATPADVKAALVGKATPNVVNLACPATGDCNLTPNRLLNHECL
jgi:subtilisin family serine protease